MRRWFASDLVSVLVSGVWVVGWAVLASPVCYQVGRGIAEVSEGKVTNGMVAKLAGWSGVAGFGDFFRVALVMGAVLGVWPLWSGARLGWRKGWREGQSLEFSRREVGRMGMGWLWAWVGVGVMLVVERGGGGVAWLKAMGAWEIGQWLGWSLVMAGVVEVVWRGVLLGLCLKEMRVELAVVVTAGVGWLAWALWDGGVAEKVVDGESMRAGWQWLDVVLDTRRQGGRWLLESFLVVGMGVVLGWARWRSRGLGWSIGLMAGGLAGWRLWQQGGGGMAGVLAGFGVLAVGVFFGIGREERE